MGPSGPTGSPDPTASIQEMNFTKNVLREKMWCTLVPFRYAISSGRPEEAAGGHRNWGVVI